jgi:AraC-like DNA-binding protein
LQLPGCAEYYPFVIRSKPAARRAALVDVPSSEAATALSAGPIPPQEWEPTLKQLVQASNAQVPAPTWWTDELSFHGQAETRAPQSDFDWDGMRRIASPPFFLFKFTLAGCGSFEHGGGTPQQIPPGTGFFAVVPSRHRYNLPEDSPGWTFGWINVYHRYLIERISKQVEATGPIVRFEPGSALLASAMRLISGCYRKDFRDRFEVELAIFEFVIAYERLAYQSSVPAGESDRLLEAVRRWVLANPKRTLNVEALAAEYGMSRSHFSRLFRERTGQTPARVVAQTRVQEAARMLLHDRASLKQIADACGFANVNHFNRIFRRFQSITPGAYRKLIP